MYTGYIRYKFCFTDGTLKVRILIALTLAFFLSGCVNSIHKGEHAALRSSLDAKPSHDLVILPADIQIFEMGVSETEEVPEWTNTGRKLVDSEVSDSIAQIEQFKVQQLPELTTEEKALLDQYTELYYPVVDAEILRTRDPAWNQDNLRTETTLGPGLSFLKEKYNIDYAVFVSGQDYISTGGRKIVALLAAAANVHVSMGFSYLTVGIVDTETGHVIWNNLVLSQELGFLTDEDVTKAVTAALETLPVSANGKQLAATE